MGSAFANGPGKRGSIPGLVITKNQKCYLMPPCLSLSILRNGSGVGGSLQQKEWFHPLCLDVVANEKGAFGSSPITVGQHLNIGIMIRVFDNGSGDSGSIPSRLIPKTQKTAVNASLLNTQHYKVRIKGKVGQSRERSSY